MAVFATAGEKTIAVLPDWPALGLTVSPNERFLLYSQFDQGGSDLMLVDKFQ